MYRKIKNAMLLLLISGSALAQRNRGGISDIKQKVDQATAPIEGIFTTVRYWLYGFFGLGVIIAGLIILFSGGRGEDKIMRLGNLFVVVVIIAIIVIVAEAIFS